MKVLIGCEFSSVVREAFRKKGFNAWSCDIIDSEDNSQYHLKEDVRKIIYDDWDLGLFFPPCTHLCVSGARWFKQKTVEQETALDFISRLMLAPIKHIAIENPIGIISTKIRKPDQIIQPYQFGHGETKATCLWLKNLPLLKPTNIVNGREPRVHKGMGYGWNTLECKRERSRTYIGIAEAMADQWGKLIMTKENNGDSK